MYMVNNSNTLYGTIASMLFWVTFALGLITGIAGQCCPPDQWEANEDVFAGQKKGNDMFVTRGMQRVSYDAKGQRIAVNGIDYTKNITSAVIQDFKTGKEYVWSNGFCRVIPIGTSFNISCVPNGATHLGKTYIGREPHMIPVDMYSFSDARLNGTTAYATVGPDCTPIEAHFAGSYPNGEGGYTEVIMFSDFTVGIKDESVFTPPDFCKTRTVSNGVGRKRRGIPFF